MGSEGYGEIWSLFPPQDLRDRLADAEQQLQDGGNRDKELSDLRKKLSEARAKAREAEPELAARQREIRVSVVSAGVWLGEV